MAEQLRVAVPWQQSSEGRASSLPGLRFLPENSRASLKVPGRAGQGGAEVGCYRTRHTDQLMASSLFVSCRRGFLVKVGRCDFRRLLSRRQDTEEDCQMPGLLVGVTEAGPLTLWWPPLQ